MSSNPKIIWNDEKRAELLHLQVNERKKLREIAKMYGVSEKSVKNQIYALRQKMREAGTDAPMAPPRERIREIKPIYINPNHPKHSTASRSEVSNECVLQRIAVQGLTAGMFGDPPRGRSALDAKNCNVNA